MWTITFLVAACLIFLIDLGGVPLRDWDEGTVAQVAREMSRAPSWSGWLHPQLWGEPYLNKPPLVHSCIAGLYRVVGVTEWGARLPGAILTASSVPLVYGVGRELFMTRLPAVMAGMVYLTLLPVVRHGRLTMLDGAVVCFFLILIGATLRSRQDLRWCLGIGLGFSLIGLTKSIIALLLLAIGLGFLVWDTPRLFRSSYLWLGLGLGAIPLGLWYGVQAHHYGNLFVEVGLQAQSFDRIWNSVEDHQGYPWYYLLELLKYSWPWLLFWPWGLARIWQERDLSWAKLLGLWTGGYLLAISVMGTKLPWYIFPLYPAIALTIGVVLAEVWNGAGGWSGVRHTPQRFPTFWTGSLSFLALVGWVGAFYFSPWGGEPSGSAQLALSLVAAGLSLGAGLAHRQNPQFIPVLAWGCYGGLVVLMTSPVWLWELNEDYPVQPIAAMIRTQVPQGQVVYTTHSHGRPSLNFYSDRHIIAVSPEQAQEYWSQADPVYLLIGPTFQAQLGTGEMEELGRWQEGDWQAWVLVRRSRS
jgi:4-amino-4-deoxy-L-arabinose transferase-like glycosyltransferase